MIADLGTRTTLDDVANTRQTPSPTTIAVVTSLSASLSRRSTVRPAVGAAPQASDTPTLGELTLTVTA